MLHKNIAGFIKIFVAIFCLAMSGCGKVQTDLPYQPVDSYTQVYMPQAYNGPVVKTFKIIDSPQTVTYGAYYGALGYPATDLPVTFAVDNTKIDSFNQANNTKYLPLPANSYDLSNTTSAIPAGQSSTPPLSVTFKTTGANAVPALKTYLLPISLTNVAAKVNGVLRTAFYVITVVPNLSDYPSFNRATWQVVGFSSQEATGEGPNNGRAIFALDGSTATYWHTQYQGATPVPPHYIIIDMGAVTALHGLSFVGRQSTGSGKPNMVNVQVSIDNVTWTDAGSFTLLNNTNLQSQFLPNGFQSARYFKVIVNSAYSATYTQIAELNAF